MAIVRGAPVATTRPAMTYAQPAMTYAQPAMTYAQPTTYAQPAMTYAQPTVTYAQPTYAQNQLFAADLNHDGVIEAGEVFAAPAVYAPTTIVQNQAFAADFNHDGIIESNEIFSAPAVFQTQLVAADLNHDGIIEANEVFQTQTVTMAQPVMTYARQPVMTMRQRDLTAGYTVIYEHAITREELMAQGRLDANPGREEQLMVDASRIANYCHNDIAVIGVVQ